MHNGRHRAMMVEMGDIEGGIRGWPPLSARLSEHAKGINKPRMYFASKDNYEGDGFRTTAVGDT